MGIRAGPHRLDDTVRIMLIPASAWLDLLENSEDTGG